MQPITFSELNNQKFPVILADPPWKYNFSKSKSRSIESHYPSMDISEICDMPVSQIAADSAILFLWTTSPKLEESFSVIRSWGFQYKTVAFTWAKENQKTPGFFMGMGYYTRQNAEYCLLATRGNVLPRKSKSVPQLIVAPRREHSRKPIEIYERIESLVDGPYLELFSRTTREKWTVWGNQTGTFEEN
jgi:N6-adenosine-specific RNA methylase IME4